MKQSWRCTICAENWPLLDAYGDETTEFENCPKCGISCWRSEAEPTMTREEANYPLFERYLERREEEDRKLLERVEPYAFAQYLMDAAEEQAEHEAA